MKWSGKPSPVSNAVTSVSGRPDDIRVRADDLLDEAPGQSLDRVAAGLAAPFARGEIALDVLGREAPEAHARVDDLDAHAVVGGDQADAGEHAMGTARQQLQAGQRLLDVLRLDEDAPADRDDGVGGEDVGVGEVGVVGDQVARGFGLGAGEARHQRARHLALARLLVDRGRTQRIRLDPDLRQQHQPARTAARQHQARAEVGTAPDRLVARAQVPQRLARRDGGAGEPGEQP